MAKHTFKLSSRNPVDFSSRSTRVVESNSNDNHNDNTVKIKVHGKLIFFLSQLNIFHRFKVFCFVFFLNLLLCLLPGLFLFKLVFSSQGKMNKNIFKTYFFYFITVSFCLNKILQVYISRASSLQAQNLVRSASTDNACRFCSLASRIFGYPIT